MKKPFSAWREGMLLYVPLLIIGVSGSAMFWGESVMVVPVCALVAGLFTLFFFRDPPRTITAIAGEAVSPADGTVVAIEDLEKTPHYDGPCKRISIFLSVFSVHVNRAPLEGTVTEIAYRPGKFKNAMRADTTDCNESNAVRMDTSHGPVTVRQISGAIARRIVCPCEVGNTLSKGEKFGMIKFGSRTELYLPPETAVRVSPKEKVRAGSTVVAHLS